MKQPDLKAKLYITMSFLCVLVLIVWGGFYVRTLSNLNHNTQNYIVQVSNRVIDTMESTFLNLEHVAVAISSHSDVKSFLKEKDPLLYHKKSSEISRLLESLYRQGDLAEHILLYNQEGIYRRFRGSLGNTASERLGLLINENQIVQHMQIVLDGVSYISYINAIYDEQQQLGSLVFLIRSEKLQDIFKSYDSSRNLIISLMANDRIIVSSDSTLIGCSPDNFDEKGSITTIRPIGLTPFKILLADNGQAIKAAGSSFAVAFLTTALLLTGMLIFFYRFLHQRFLNPVFNIIQNAQNIGIDTGSEYLTPTGQVYFDSLVEQINSMVKRLQENRQAIFDLNIKRQRAIILSLKKQINAHFMVNTLNVIKRLNENGQQYKVRDMCDGLSYLLRYINGAEEYIDGIEEIFLLEKYVDIMQIRYPDSFTTVFDIDEQIDSVRMPRMLIQPLIENAILHGLCPAGKKGRLTVSVRIEYNIIAFCVADNGVGIASDKLKGLKKSIEQANCIPWDEMGLEHIAIPNIQKRIVSLFGEEYGLCIDSKEKEGTTVTLLFPAQLIPCPAAGTV